MNEAEYSDDFLYQAGLTGVQVEYRPDLSYEEREEDDERSRA